MKIEILPSLLAADLGHLAAELTRTVDAGADALHLDIMDGHFVPNLSFAPDTAALCHAILPNGYPLNTHLMITDPAKYAPRFIEKGATTIQFHLELDLDVRALAADIHARGAKVGLALNPDTPAERLLPYLDCADEVLCMTVFPGYGGQSFIHDVLPKIAQIRAAAPVMNIMVDGGINAETAVLAAQAGANQFVAGSYLYKQTDMRAAIADMRARILAVYA